MKEQKVITIRSARVVPLLLLVTAVCMGLTHSYWWFLSIPFVAIGWISAAPNLNLVNGMFAYLSMIGGFILLHFHEAAGASITLGAMASFYLCSIEMRVTAKPYVSGEDEQEKQPNKTPEHISEGRERPSENAQR